MSEARQQQAVSVSMRAGRLPRDLAVILLLGAMLAVLIVAGEYVALPAVVAWPIALARLVLGLSFVLYLPGHQLTNLLFPRRNDLDDLERWGLSLALSVSWVSLIVLVLDRLPWGIRLWPIFWGELLSILVFTFFANWRRQRLRDVDDYDSDADQEPSGTSFGLSRLIVGVDRRVILLCASMLVAASLSAIWFVTAPRPDQFFTEFYLLGEKGESEGFPWRPKVGEQLTVTVGIVNAERQTQDYRIEAWAVEPWGSRREQLASIGPITLQPGARVEQRIQWAMPLAGANLKTDFYLFRVGDDLPYRTTTLWLNVVD